MERRQKLSNNAQTIISQFIFMTQPGKLIYFSNINPLQHILNDVHSVTIISRSKTKLSSQGTKSTLEQSIYSPLLSFFLPSSSFISCYNLFQESQYVNKMRKKLDSIRTSNLFKAITF